MPKNVVLYGRVSTDEQGEKNTSVPTQIEKLNKYCALKEWNVLATFEETFSAWKTFDRPEYTKFRQFIRENKNKVDYLLFTQWSRFSRDSGNAQTELKTLKGLGIEANAIEQWVDMSIPENLYMLSFYIAAPQVESDRLSLRVKDALRRNLKDGKWMGKAPYGYSNDKASKLILPDPNTKDIVSFAFNTFATGSFNIEEVRKMAAENGLSLQKQQFINMLSNPFYIGKIYVKASEDEEEQYVRGLHEAIIEESVFNTVKDILAGKRKPYSGKTKGEDLPLKGHLICPICHRVMTGSASKSRNGNHYHYYHCQRLYGCKNSFNAESANDAFEVHLSKYKVDPEVLSLYYLILEDVFKSNNEDRELEKKRIETEIVNVNKSIAQLDDKMLKNELKTENYNRLIETLQRQKTEAEGRYRLLVNSASEYAKYIEYSTAFLADVVGYYKTVPLSTKQKIVGSIFPEKFEFDGKDYRTAKTNAVFDLICSLDKGFKQELLSISTEQSTWAPPSGLEPETL